MTNCTDHFTDMHDWVNVHEHSRTHLNDGPKFEIAPQRRAPYQRFRVHIMEFLDSTDDEVVEVKPVRMFAAPSFILSYSVYLEGNTGCLVCSATCGVSVCSDPLSPNCCHTVTIDLCNTRICMRVDDMVYCQDFPAHAAFTLPNNAIRIGHGETDSSNPLSGHVILKNLRIAPKLSHSAGRASVPRATPSEMSLSFPQMRPIRSLQQLSRWAPHEFWQTHRCLLKRQPRETRAGPKLLICHDCGASVYKVSLCNRLCVCWLNCVLRVMRRMTRAYRSATTLRIRTHLCGGIILICSCTSLMSLCRFLL